MLRKVLVILLSWQRLFVFCQESNPVTILENAVSQQLTFNIPPNTAASNIQIRLDNGDGSILKKVMFVFLGDFSTKISEEYIGRLTATSSAPQRKVEMVLSNIRRTDAGTYRCFEGAANEPLLNCGQKLILVRKPNPPKVIELTSALEGQTLKLSCNTSSTSLPPNHGLKSQILWRDDKMQIIASTTTEKYSMDSDGNLHIKNIERIDKGKKFTCTSSDKAVGITSAPESDLSPLYEVQPEFKPVVSDLVLTPPVVNDVKITRKESEEMTYTCEITCIPVCTVQWSFKSVFSTSFSPLTEGKTLKLKVQRTDHGTYRCSGTNRHGVASKEFELEVHYITQPVLSINGQTEDNLKIVANEQARIHCVIDALPAPQFTLRSPLEVLKTETGKDPKTSTSGGVFQNNFSSYHTLNGIQCEDSGIYSCEGNNEVKSMEERKNIIVTCPPSRTITNQPELILKPDYIWEMSRALKFSFVIKAFPVPTVTKVMSKVNTIAREEVFSRDVSITKDGKFDNKDYLTKFTFATVRSLDINDKDRVFTMTFVSADFTRDLEFAIKPRGPPQPVTNVSTVDITHSSVKLFWFAEFNGGEHQFFNVEYRHYTTDPNSPWMVAAKDIQDQDLPGMWTEVVITNLADDTDYEFRIVSTNTLGSLNSKSFRVKTIDNPDDALSAGGIAGIVIAVIIIIVIVLIVLYVFIYRRKWGKQKETGEVRKAMLPERLTKVFSRSKQTHVKQEPNGIATISNDKPKHAAIFKGKGRKIFAKSKPKDLYPNRKNSEEESDNENYDDDRYVDEAEDGDYINTELRRLEPDGDEYLNANELKQQAADRKAEKKKKDELNYVSIDFNQIEQARDKKKKKKQKKEAAPPSVTTGPYSDIDFEKTKELREKMLAEQMLHGNDPEYDHSMDTSPSMDTSAEDGDDKRRQKPPLELMGTAV